MKLECNKALVDILQAGGTRKGLPPHSIQLVPTTDREAVRELAQLSGRVDVVIPRGGEQLIRTVTEMAHIPVIKHYKGVCYAYVDEAANQDMALTVLENAKCSRPGVCNAIEKVLVHEAIATEFLPKLANLMAARQVELRGDDATRQIIPDMKPATDADWGEEYLDLILTVGVVPSLEAAIEHINRHGSHHSDVILSEDEKAQTKFLEEVDTACVPMLPPASRMAASSAWERKSAFRPTNSMPATDGAGKLTTYKYIIHGTGQPT